MLKRTMLGLMFVTAAAPAVGHAAERADRKAEYAPAATAKQSIPTRGERREWTVNGVRREALVFAPPAATTTASPLLFVFHGHSGTMGAMAEKWDCQTLWPEAIVVYPQGLPAPGGRDPEGKRPGWQHMADDLEKRDLYFFDAMLESLKDDFKIDPSRIYAAGFSNGSAFTYVLWQTRGDLLAAVAPCAGGSDRFVTLVQPKPVFIASGENDPRVEIAEQQKAIAALKKVNGCSDKGEPWEDAVGKLYPSEVGTPVATYIHPGKHVIPPEVPPLVVKFFKSQELGKRAAQPQSAISK